MGKLVELAKNGTWIDIHKNIGDKTWYIRIMTGRDWKNCYSDKETLPEAILAIEE